MVFASIIGVMRIDTMQSNNYLIASLIAAGLCCGAPLCRAQLILLYSAESKTVVSDGGTAALSSIATRLFMDDWYSTAAPLDTAIWFVADLNHNGVPAESVGSSQVPLESVLGSDDRLLFQDVLDGDQPGSIAGRYRNLSISVSGLATEAAAIKNANIYVYLWSGAGSTFSPDVNSTFGILNLGINPPPTGLGNAFWGIDQNISAAQFTVVPEPGAWGAVSAGLLVTFGLARRLFRSLRRP